MSSPLATSTLLAGHQCLRRAWIEGRGERHHGLHPLAREARRRESARVEALAAGRFPGAVAVDAESPVAHTRALIDGATPAILGAVLQTGDAQTRIDVLVRRPGGWRVVDVRSGVRIRPGHVADLALQTAIARRAGLPVTEAGVLYLRRGYVRGEALDVRRLFVARDLTERVDAVDIDLDTLPGRVRRTLDRSTEPDVAPGSQCDSPWRCPFAGHCGAPSADTRARPPLAARDAVAAGIPWFSEDLRRHVDTPHPWHFLDFEAYAPAVPCAPGLHPYQSLPFLWALVSDDGERVDTASHQVTEPDPRRDFARSLLAAVPPHGPVIVWSAYEARMLGSLAAALPDLARPLLALRSRVVDLLAVVRRGVWHPGFDGSYSLKAVAPVLAGDVAWDDPTVSDGRQAALLALGLHNGTIRGDEARRLRASLATYCEADAHAVRGVWIALRRRVTALA